MAVESVEIKGKSVAVFRSIGPWVESIMHHNGAKAPTTNVDFNKPKSFDTRLRTNECHASTLLFHTPRSRMTVGGATAIHSIQMATLQP